jgi:hypothetical protein
MRDLFEDRENEFGPEILQAPRAWCVLNQNDMVASSPVGTVITGFGSSKLGVSLCRIIWRCQEVLLLALVSPTVCCEGILFSDGQDALTGGGDREKAGMRYALRAVVSEDFAMSDPLHGELEVSRSVPSVPGQLPDSTHDFAAGHAPTGRRQ